MDVLKNRQQVTLARTELKRRGLSSLDSSFVQFLRRLRVYRKVGVGDELKSWDVLKTVEFIEKNIPRTMPVLDIGAYASEVLSVLHRLGYEKLVGVDTNPRLQRSPYSDSIRYEVADFMRTPFEDGSFSCITAISVIEHGFDGKRLLREVSRLLAPGGYFVASFDYWPEKIDTSGQLFFGMDWMIFSEDDVRGFVDEALQHSLQPIGDLSFAAEDRPVNCVDRQYTFGWLVLRKSTAE